MHEGHVNAFKKLSKTGELRHAYLFYGDEGIGKRTFARSLAYLLERGTFEDKGSILSDAQILGPSDDAAVVRMRPVGVPSPVLDATSNIEIHIEAIRKLEKMLWQTPVSSPKKTVLIEDAHRLNEKAQSALLKIVEEPPRHALLIFITHDSGALLAPLRSRLSKVYFQRMSGSDLSAYLVREKKISERKSQNVANASFGRIGRALELCGGIKNGATLEARLWEKIVALRNGGVEANAEVLARLLDYAAAFERYQINPKLQEKAVEYAESKIRVQ